MSIRRRTRRIRRWRRRNQDRRWFLLGCALIIAVAAVTALLLVMNAFQHV